MRFQEKILKDAIEHSALRLAVIALSVTTLTFGVLLAADVAKDPVIIERGCETALAKAQSASQSKEEIDAFLDRALRVRFNTESPADPSSYLVQDLLVSRAKEQEELKNRGIDQRLIFRWGKLEGDHFVVEADRLIAVGSVRSALPIKLNVKISSKPRSLTNPYGLILTSVTQLEGKDEKQK